MTWPVQGGGSGSDYGKGITSLSDGSSIVTGSFEGTASFGDTTLTSAGDTDVFIAKLNADGTYAWATKAGGSNGDLGRGITSLSDGSSIVTGDFRGSASFGDTTLTSAGNHDVFIAKLNADGSYAWATKAGGSSNDHGDDITSLSDGSSIVTGDFVGTANFGDTTLTSTGNYDTFIAKLNADGTYAWATKAGGSSSDYGRGITSLSDGSSIVTGFFSGSTSFGSTTFSADNYDGFISKFNADGSCAWATQVGGSYDELGLSVASLRDGSSIVTGYFYEEAIFGDTTLTSAGKSDIFVAKLNNDGTYAWATKAGGTERDVGDEITSLSDGSTIVTGVFKGTASFGETTLTSAGDLDVFIAKLNADGSYGWATKAGGASADWGYGITSLSDGSSIVTGFFQGTASIGDKTLTSAGTYDAFIAKLNADGSWVDSTPPSAPSAPDLIVASDSGSSNSDNLSNVTTPTFTGTAEANSSVELFADSTSIGTSTADNSGNWSHTVQSASALANGTYSITAKAIDAAGNTSSASSALSLTIDLTPPAAPSAPDLIAASDSGSSNSDNLTNDTTPSFSGTAETNSSVELFAGLNSIGTSTSDSSGKWTHTVQSGSALANGTYSITAKATNSLGNTSIASSALNLTIDTTAPVFSSVSSATSFDENIGTSQVVYTAATSDASEVTYNLKQDNNDDTSSFSINSTSGQVTLSANPDYETKPSYTLTVRATDLAGNSSDKSITLNVNDQNDTPVINFTKSKFNENIDAFSVISTLSAIDPDTNQSSNVELTNGVGDDDNSSFSIIDNSLIIKTSPDFETKSSYNIRLKTPDNDGTTYEQAFTLAINDLNEAPLDINLSVSIFNENIESATAVATLTTSDDAGDTHSYSLVNGSGDTDNNSFMILGNKLVIKESPDYESKSSYDIRLQTKDSSGLIYSESETLNVNNIIGTKADPITGETFYLDVDGDGEMTALGDGLMIIRKLIGPAFADDALTNKARSNTATRSTQEIHEFIEQGISDGVLDVDGDGKTTPLGDGLMIIRNLIGPAFAGDALISKAMSAESPYFGETNAADLVTANIEALKPPDI